MNSFVDSLTDWPAQLWNLAASEVSGYANKQTRSVQHIVTDPYPFCGAFVNGQSIKIIKIN